MVFKIIFMKIAVVGVTGLVGTEMMKMLENLNQKFSFSVMAVASERSVGKKIPFLQQEVEVCSVENAIAQKPEFAIFSAGAAVSEKYAPQFAANGTTVIDNSSAWRMQPEIPLIVPEINASILNKNHKIIANPNCSTIQMVMALAPLHRKYGIKRLVISTYQSVSGTGVKAVKQLFGERNGETVEKAYPHPIDLNVLPHGGNFLDNGYTTEEEKLVNETRKILNDNLIAITATVVRVPVVGGHSESVNVEFCKPYELVEVRTLLEHSQGIVVQDDPKNNLYPMPIFAHHRNEVFVGRIRRDESQPNTLNMWIVSDNLRKGAATNAVQIVEYLIDNHLF